jgi:P4 family phage/plasmid primase-like protien
LGPGKNGKSVLCGGLDALLGLANVCHVHLEDFGRRFALTATLGKLANIASEVGELDRAAEGVLKSFTSGDRMTFDRKNILPVNALPTARLVLATNNHPPFRDRSEGLWRRMLFVPFDVTIQESERIEGLDKPEYWIKWGELPGMLNWALAGLHRLRKNGRFTEPEICRAAVEQYKLDCNSARLFFREECSAREDGQVGKARLYKAYRQYCARNGLQVLSNPSFGREVLRQFPMVTEARLGGRDHRLRFYCGIALIAHGADGAMVEPELIIDPGLASGGRDGPPE